MTAMLATRSPQSWSPTSRDLEEFADVPACARSGTDAEARACRALRLRRDGLDWGRVAREVGFLDVALVRRMALEHLEEEEA